VALAAWLDLERRGRTMNARRFGAWAAVLGLAVGLGGAATAQEPPKAGKGQGPARGAKGGPRGPARFLETMQKLDINGDRVIERSEVPDDGLAAFDRLLARGDANKDGKLDGEEFRAMVERVRPAAEGIRGAALGRLKAMDADGDGKVSRTEFAGRPQQFDRLDADSDGFVTEAEAKQSAGGGGAGMGPRLKAMDADGDGKVSAAEYSGPKPLFDRLDRNGDGFLAPGEVPAAGAGPGAGPAGGGLDAMDADGDGAVSREEYRGPARQFERLDRNADGRLTSDERPKRARPAAGQPARKKAAKPGRDS
jgi:hypothetical protein